ncbi:hypothetical protein FALBO_720 [Fusarium albosuccineum]|uniref:Uncharacterized protein n=1 Tax=Fusarium albosuccineum TaxID=1237068 RepID=A0A8H4PM94_9HYPO|nr:hypothetical protein FALBO_720 [Fusarium albosuccineum]
MTQTQDMQRLHPQLDVKPSSISTPNAWALKVFDSSGKLPFSIVFGLCRRSSQDADHRPLHIDTADSILDVPFAISNKLLTLLVYDAEKRTDIEVDVGQLGQTDSQEQSYLILPSPIGRTENWKKCISIYQYNIDHKSQLASLLKPGRKYTIRHRAGQDLGSGWYTESPEELRKPASTSSDNQKLVISRADGRASFQVVPCLPWPPKIQTRMQWCRSRGDMITFDEKDGAMRLEITVSNAGAEAINVQTRGRQRFLIPWGPMEPEEDYPALDPRPRIIDLKSPAPRATIQVIDMTTNTIVRGATKPGVCGLYEKHDPRPKLELLETLEPGKPLVRQVNIGSVVSDLPDGKYALRMEPRGMWWCAGRCEDFAAEGEDRVPQHLFKTMIPPLMLECEHVVQVQVENGVVGWYPS